MASEQPRGMWEDWASHTSSIIELWLLRQGGIGVEIQTDRKKTMESPDT